MQLAQSLLLSSPLASKHLLNGDLNSTPQDSDVLQNSFLNKRQLFLIYATGEIEIRAALEKCYPETSYSPITFTHPAAQWSHPCVEKQGTQANAKLKRGNQILLF